MHAKARDNLAFLSIARQLHLQVHCVYVADANVKWLTRGPDRLVRYKHDPDTYLGNPKDGD
jgi:hypothetical protein